MMMYRVMRIVMSRKGKRGEGYETEGGRKGDYFFS